MSTKGFNSRSRMGSDDNVGDVAYPLGVSIHAPAWGATFKGWRLPVSCPFQFTLPHGERPPAHALDDAPESVSIHAPAWGATLYLM